MDRQIFRFTWRASSSPFAAISPVASTGRAVKADPSERSWTIRERRPTVAWILANRGQREGVERRASSTCLNCSNWHSSRAEEIEGTRDPVDYYRDATNVTAVSALAQSEVSRVLLTPIKSTPVATRVEILNRKMSVRSSSGAYKMAPPAPRGVVRVYIPTLVPAPTIREGDEHVTLCNRIHA